MRRSQRHSCSALPTLKNNSNSVNNNNSSSGKDDADAKNRRRRTTSFGKLSHFFQNVNILSDSGSIQTALLDLSTTGKLITKIADSQRRGVESLATWAHNAGNAAIDDVMQQTRQLYEIFTDKEVQFSRQYMHYVQQLQKIADAERAVKDAEQNVLDLDEKEKKLRREIAKGASFFRQRRGGDLYLLKQKLEEIKTSKEQAEHILSDLRAEMEVVKMFRFRNGMQGIADAYQELARSCQAIFSCQREIIEMVPAVSNQDVRQMIYSGSPLTRDRVENLRRSLQHGLTVSENTVTSAPRRRSEPKFHLYQSQNSSPPPPYTLTAAAAAPRNIFCSEHQTGSNDCQVNRTELQTCCHCGHPVQRLSNHHLNHPILTGSAI